MQTDPNQTQSIIRETQKKNKSITPQTIKPDKITRVKNISIVRDNKLIPLRQHALRKYIGLCLHIDYTDKSKITYDNKEKFISFINEQIHVHNLSPTQISVKYDLESKDFGHYLRITLDIQTKTIKQSLQNFHIQNGSFRTDEKYQYYKTCEFKFSPYNFPNIIGYNLLKEHKVYNPVTNINGFQRDHIYSKSDGWKNNVDPYLISHPANCEILINNDNQRKGNSSRISLENLIQRVYDWDNGIITPLCVINNKRSGINHSQETKNAISSSLKKFNRIKKAL